MTAQLNIKFWQFLILFFVLSSTHAQPKIKIGLSTALSGPAATFGTDVKNALLFANKEIARDRYEILVEDDKCNGKDAVSVAQKLINLDHVKYVFGNCSATILSAAPTYDKAGVLVFAPIATAPDISAASDKIFRMAPDDTNNAKTLFNYIASHNKRLGILTEQSDYSQSFLKAFLANNKDNALEISSESYLATDMDFRAVLLRFSQKKIDALFINSNTEYSFSVILKQLQQMHNKLSIYGAYYPGSPTFRKLVGDLAEGIIYTDFPSVDDLMTAESKSLVEKFQAQYGKMNSWELALFTTIEAVRALDQAIQSGEDVKSYLYANEFSGIWGKYHFNENGDLIGLSNVLNQIKDGKVVRMKG